MNKTNENSHSKVPSVVIAALRGGSGKTIASLGIIRALNRRGMEVGCFKKGPDYIDAAWLALAAKRACYNLDPFLMDEETIKKSFSLRAKTAQFSVIEGNRGLFDGLDLQGSASTARLASLLGTPVILVVDCTKATRTIAAMVLGCMRFDPDVSFLGVILNQVAGPRHEKVVTEAIVSYTGLPVLGHIPRLRKDPLPMRHLGLTPTDEFTGATQALDQLADIAEANMDLDRLIELANKKATEIDPNITKEKLFNCNNKSFSGITIGIIRDAAFQFYYPENIEALRCLGAKTIFLKATTDSSIPSVDGIYIGGGFPETQASQLSKNESFKRALHSLCEKGLPVYAECGGLMYLGQSIHWDKQDFPMAGIIPYKFEMEKRPVGHGYTRIKFLKDSPFFKKGAEIKGHEFHYSRPVPCAKNKRAGNFACRVLRGTGFDGKNEGYVIGNTFSTYTHVHVLGEQSWASSFLEGVSRAKQA